MGGGNKDRGILNPHPFVSPLYVGIECRQNGLNKFFRPTLALNSFSLQIFSLQTFLFKVEMRHLAEKKAGGRNEKEKGCKAWNLWTPAQIQSLDALMRREMAAAAGENPTLSMLATCAMAELGPSGVMRARKKPDVLSKIRYMLAKRGEKMPLAVDSWTPEQTGALTAFVRREETVAFVFSDCTLTRSLATK
jgi:hypothetical protein